MDILRSELLRLADDVALALQNAARSFAFYSDGRDLVEIETGESGDRARFPDHADEGWPAVECPLPSGVRFHQALSAVLTRSALFMVEAGGDEVRAQLSEAGLRLVERDGVLIARLGRGADLKVISGTRKLTALHFRQRRNPDSVVDALRSLADRRRGRSSDSEDGG